MKVITLMIACLMILSVAGCAKKTAAQQMQEDLNKAGKQLNQDVNKAFK